MPPNASPLSRERRFSNSVRTELALAQHRYRSWAASGLLAGRFVRPAFHLQSAVLTARKRESNAKLADWIEVLSTPRARTPRPPHERQQRWQSHEKKRRISVTTSQVLFLLANSSDRRRHRWPTIGPSSRAGADNLLSAQMVTRRYSRTAELSSCGVRNDARGVPPPSLRTSGIE